MTLQQKLCARHWRHAKGMTQAVRCWHGAGPSCATCGWTLSRGYQLRRPSDLVSGMNQVERRQTRWSWWTMCLTSSADAIRCRSTPSWSSRRDIPLLILHPRCICLKELWKGASMMRGGSWQRWLTLSRQDYVRIQVKNRWKPKKTAKKRTDFVKLWLTLQCNN